MCVHDARARRGDWIRRANDRRILTRTSRRRVRVILANACASSANRGTVSDSRLREESMYPRRSTTSTAQFARESSSFVIFGHLQTGTTGSTGSTGTTGVSSSINDINRAVRSRKIAVRDLWSRAVCSRSLAIRSQSLAICDLGSSTTGTTGSTGSGGSTGRRRKNEKIFKIFEANLLKTTP